MAQKPSEGAADEWVSFPGGELEGRRPRTLCPACREALQRASVRGRAAPRDNRRARTLCFACYRAELDRRKAIAAAGALDTASDARFQYQLPFEPLDHPRLEMLKADRAASRNAALATPAGARAASRDASRRRAQIAARHALQEIAAGLRARRAANVDRDRAMASAFHAAEVQLPDSWIPFVMSR